MDEVKCIVAIVERGKADRIIKSAKQAGARGATIIYGRGTGESEVVKFLKMHIEASKEVIIIICKEAKYKGIYESIIETGKLKEPGTGIIFTLPVENLVGLYHRKNFEK